MGRPIEDKPSSVELFPGKPRPYSISAFAVFQGEADACLARTAPKSLTAATGNSIKAAKAGIL